MTFMTAIHTHNLMDSDGQEIAWVYRTDAGAHFVHILDDSCVSEPDALTMVQERRDPVPARPQ
jgi:hypothetical protein